MVFSSRVFATFVENCLSSFVVGNGPQFKNKAVKSKIISGKSPLLGGMLAVCAVLALPGCASVKVSLPGTAAKETPRHASANVSQRAALIKASSRLNETPWPTPTKTSAKEKMVGLLFGHKADENTVSEGQALDIYLADLTATSAPGQKILKDADRSLMLARHVAEAGRLAATAYPPRRDDLIALEGAIGDIRQCREMYVAAMKKLRSDGAAISDRDIKEVKRAFTQTIRDVGMTANLLADRADDPDRAVQYAAPLN